MSNYLKNKMLNILESTTQSEGFFSEECEDDTNAGNHSGYVSSRDGDTYPDYDDEYDDEDFDIYDDDEDFEECDECNVVLNYSVETIPVFEQDGEYYVEYSMLEKYMNCNNIDSVSEAVSNLCRFNKIDKSDLSVVVEAAKKKKKKVSKSKAKKITFAQSKLADAINKGITVKKGKRKKRK